MRRQVAVKHHGDELAPHGQPIQRLAQVLTGGALDAVGSRHHAVERAMFGKPLGSGLGAHFVDAGHVVHGVADQGQVVNDAFRRHAKFGLDAFDVEPLVAHRVDERYVGVDQLRKVFVTRGDHDTVAALCRHARQRADGVVSLDAGHFNHWPAEQPHHFMDGRDLLYQQIWHGRALGFVLVVPSVAKRRAFGVKDARRLLCRELLAQPLHHGHHAVYRACGQAFG